MRVNNNLELNTSSFRTIHELLILIEYIRVVYFVQYCMSEKDHD